MFLFVKVTTESGTDVSLSTAMLNNEIGMKSEYPIMS